MQKYYLSLILLISFFAKSQTTLFTENFNGTTNLFTLNTAGATPNQWLVNTVYAGFPFLSIVDTPAQTVPVLGHTNSKYMHINNTSVCGFGICNANFDASSISDNYSEMTTAISTVGYTAVNISFFYLCEGETNSDYGTVEYSRNGGAWTVASALLQNQGTWVLLNLTNAQFDGATTLKFRFRWQNDDDSSGLDPAFSVDDIIIKGTGAAATKVKLFSVANPIPVFYDTLKEAFDAVNAGNYTGTLSIEIYGDTTETAKAILNASGTGASSYTTLSIKPIGGVRTISGNLSVTELIGLNGADNVTIDGNIAGVNSLVISNTSTSRSLTCTIRFLADATNNIVTNCNVLGSSKTIVGTNGGNIWFASGAIATGNDNNTISNCNISPAGVNSPSKGVYFSGTSAVLNNSGNIITNNNFIDIFSVDTSSAGIYSGGGSTGSTITNNKFYQTATKTFTVGQTHSAINITGGGVAEGFTITGNTIGYANNSGTGTYTLNANSFAPKFYGIYFNGKTAGISSTISNNTISNISLTGGISTGAGNTNPFSAIYLEKGLVTSNNNIIGSQTATGSLIFSTSSTSATDVFGMFNNATNDSWTANNNSIGGITANNLAVAGAGTFIVYGFRASTGIAATFTATNNLIGGTIANSIQNYSNLASSQLIGLMTNSSALNATSNIIRNLTTTSPNTNGTTTASLIGILVNNTSTSHTLSKNIINNLSNTNTTAQTTVNGIVFSGNIGAGTTNTVEKNQIYGLTSSTNNALAQVNGILASNGNTTYKNNFITLGANINNAIEISGINEFLGTNNFWHNSIYIGGSPTSGTTRSFAFNASQVSNTRSFRNNIFWNARNNSGTATGKNYIVRVGGSSINPTGLTVNNNVYYGTGSGSVFGFFNNLDVTSFAAWTIAVGQDVNSQVANPSYIDPTNAVPDLHIPASTCSNPRPTSSFIAVTDDIDDNIRSTTSPNIGADENNIPTFTWSGTWSPAGTPDINSVVIFNADYNMASNPSIDACSVIIGNGLNVPIVTISSGKSLNIQNDLTINNGAILNVLDKGSLVQINDSGLVTNNGTGIANVTRNTTPYEKYDYTYWSSPVFNPTIGSSLAAWRQNYSFDFNANNFLDLYAGSGFPQTTGAPDSFDDNDDDWLHVLQTTTMTQAKGYAIMENDPGPYPITTPVTFSGKINNGAITIPMQLSPGILDPNDDFNLVGNPYPSAISANDFINNNLPNISGTLYFWTHKGNVSSSNPGPCVYNFTNDDYAYYNLAGGIATLLTVGTGSNTGSLAPSGFIASGQGFMVDAQNTNNLVFNNSLRSKNYNNTNFWKPANSTQKDRIWLNLTNSDGMFNQQLIGYFNNATIGYDQAYDATIMKGPSNINFYSSAQSEFYKIQARPTFIDTDEVPVGYTCTSNGNFTIAIDKQEGVFDAQNIYLQDNDLNIVHDLKQSPYNFVSTFGTFNDRFILKYTNATLQNITYVHDDNTVKIAVKDSKINIFSNLESIKSIQIFDVLGRKIYDNQSINDKKFSIDALFNSNQTLIIKTKLENNTIQTSKIVF